MASILNQISKASRYSTQHQPISTLLSVDQFWPASWRYSYLKIKRYAHFHAELLSLGLLCSNNLLRLQAQYLLVSIWKPCAVKSDEVGCSSLAHHNLGESNLQNTLKCAIFWLPSFPKSLDLNYVISLR